MGYSAMRALDPMSRAILAAGGLTEKDIKPVLVPNVMRSADDFVSGAADMFMFAFGAPKVREVDVTRRWHALSWKSTTSPEWPKPARFRRSAISATSRPGPIFVGVDKPMKTYTIDNILFTHAKVSDDVVYKLIETMEANKADLIAVAPNLREFAAANLAKDYTFPIHPGALKYFKDKNIASQGVPVNDKLQSSGAAGQSAASEERFVASAEEFAATASKTTLILTNLLQGILVACVVLWVMDVPRQVFNLSFYTEQLLTACLGLTLALAFVVESRQRISRHRSGRRDRRRHHSHLHRVSLSQSAQHPAAALDRARRRAGLDVHGEPAEKFARAFDYASAAVSLILCGYIFVRYEPLTYELAMLPTEGIIGSAILLFLVLEGSRRTSGFGFVAIILAMAVYVYISPNFSGDFQTRWVSPERMVAYLGLDTNSMIGAILAVAVLIVIPFTIMGQVLARTGGADFFSDVAMAAMGRFRGGSAKIAVVGSALFGMISGSAVSNVLAVGIVTIPTMIKAGFSRYKAAAIESVGSTGGQLMPPVMGASAFIMAEFLQVSYGAVCVAAAIPAILYYACLFIHVDLDAAKQKIGAVQDPDAPPLGRSVEIGLAFSGADRFPGVRADLS